MRMKQCIGIMALFFFGMSACNLDGNQKGRYANLDQPARVKLKQYLIEGKRLYQLHCINCHQEGGTGLARLYPPLKNSDYLFTNKPEVICGMRFGQKGEIVVNGIVFNQPMPENLRLTDLEIAEIATYVYNTFADTVQLVTVQEVKQIFANCPPHMLSNRDE